MVAAGYQRISAAHPGRFLLGLGASHAHVVERRGGRYLHPYRTVAGFLDELDSVVPARAREIARGALRIYLQAPNYIANLQRQGFTGDDIGGASDRLVDALVVWGDQEAIARRVAEHQAAGADHVCVQVLTGEPALPRAEWRALAAALA